jgi:hypothetical protein
MFPSHCKEVSVKFVKFELSKESIVGYLSGKKGYIRTKYYVFHSGDDWAVASVEKKDTSEVLQPILSVRILALPDETSFVEDPSLDVLSASSMGRLRERCGSKCVVVRGRAEHISFFIDEHPRELTIVDVVPPSPSKLVGLVESVLESDLQDWYVKYRTVVFDLNEIARGHNSDLTMFPCRASGLHSDRRCYYLDETPELSEDDIAKVTLIGCSLSARIFKAVYGTEPRMINMCPFDLASENGVKGRVLVKCCKIKEGFEVKGRIALVPWGARASEVADALRVLLV